MAALPALPAEGGKAETWPESLCHGRLSVEAEVIISREGRLVSSLLQPRAPNPVLGEAGKSSAISAILLHIFVLCLAWPLSGWEVKASPLQAPCSSLRMVI